MKEAVAFWMSGGDGLQAQQTGDRGQAEPRESAAESGEVTEGERQRVDRVEHPSRRDSQIGNESQDAGEDEADTREDDGEAA